MHRTASFILSLSLVTACQPDDGDDLGAETSESGDGDGEPSGDGDGDPSGDGDGEPSGDGDGEPSGDGDGEPSGDGDGDGDPGVSYSAEASLGSPGFASRIQIRRSDVVNDTCAVLSIITPENRGDWDFNVAMPGGWAVEWLRLRPGADCPATPSPSAETGTGTIEFVTFDAVGFPCELNLDASFDVSTDPPSTVSFDTSGLLVDGVECEP